MVAATGPGGLQGSLTRAEIALGLADPAFDAGTSRVDVLVVGGCLRALAHGRPFSPAGVSVIPVVRMMDPPVRVRRRRNLWYSGCQCRS